jgi:hypothetical protein
LGKVGNGICTNPNACCSQQGWCGFGKDYCTYYHDAVSKSKVETLSQMDPLTMAIPRPMKGQSTYKEEHNRRD